MQITSFAFLCFYAAVLLLYYIVPKKIQWVFLLAVSIGYFLIAGELWMIIYPVLRRFRAADKNHEKNG